MSSLVSRSLLALLLAFVPLCANAEAEPVDPFFGEALFYANQGDYFAALQRLDAEMAQHYGVDERALDSFYRHIDDAEFSVGDFELRYRMHLRAGRAIRAVLEGDVEESKRADAAYRLARIHFQKGQSEDAIRVLDAMADPVPESLQDDVAFLRANVLMALGRSEEAVAVLRELQGSDDLLGFAAYNLGVALLENSEPVAAAAQLDRAGRVAAEDRETRAIRDKANLVLGTLFFEAEEYELAQRSLDRVRVDGPFSNQALLRAGWAEASAEHFDRAVVPWSILARRDATDAAVQEALLALPYAYSKLDVHGRAAVLYESAVSSFGSELEKLDASIVSVQDGEFLKALEREEIRQDKDWVVRLRSLPEAPETFYLISLMASHDFQTGLQNYLDLTDMKRKLVEWRRSLDSFEDIIRLRRDYLEPRMPEVDRVFRKLDAQMRLRLEQREHLDERLNKMLTAPAPELLATAAEHTAMTRLERLLDLLDASGSSAGTASNRARIERLRGLLHFRLETEYHERLTEAHDHLRELNAHVDSLQEQYDAFVARRQAATHSYVGYAGRLDDLEKRVAGALDQIEKLKARQGRSLEQVAERELAIRRDRLAAYQNKARFAFADSYDRAAKMRAR